MANEVLVYETIGDRETGGGLPVNYLAKQTLSIGGAASGAFNASTQQVIIVVSTDCVVEFGAAPDGNGVTFPLSAGHIYKFNVTARSKVIAAAGTATAPKVNPGTVTVTGAITQAEFIAALKSATGTHSSVNSGTASVTILASNAARKGAKIRNTDANNLFLDFTGGTAVAATRSQKKLATGEDCDVPAGYTGAITGIWDVDGSGVASVAEFTV